MYAWETGPADDLSMLLLCGEADFKVIPACPHNYGSIAHTVHPQLISNSAFIDRKIKYQIPPKSNIALKHLRTQVSSLLAHQFRGKPLLESQVLWNEMASIVLGKMKVEEEDAEQAPAVTVN